MRFIYYFLIKKKHHSIMISISVVILDAHFPAGLRLLWTASNALYAFLQWNPCLKPGQPEPILAVQKKSGITMGLLLVQ